MTKIFKPLIDHIVEVYIDDIVVKSKTRIKHAQHLEQTFRLMRNYNMKLNPTKCSMIWRNLENLIRTIILYMK